MPVSSTEFAGQLINFGIGETNGIIMARSTWLAHLCLAWNRSVKRTGSSSVLSKFSFLVIQFEKMFYFW